MGVLKQQMFRVFIKIMTTSFYTANYTIGVTPIGIVLIF